MSAIAPIAPQKTVSPVPDDLLGGRVISCATAAQFAAALAGLQHLDTLLLNGGETYVGNFRPRATPPDWRWQIRGSLEGLVYRPGRRMTREMAALGAPKLLTPNQNAPFGMGDGVHGGRLIGLELGVAPERVNAVTYDLLSIGWGTGGNGAHASADMVSSQHSIEGCYLRGALEQNVRRGIFMNGRDVQVHDTLIEEIHEPGFDSQGLLAYNTPGTFRAVNTDFHGAGQGVMLGGADPQGPEYVPADFIFDRCDFTKPLHWNPSDPSYAGRAFVIKPGFELKLGRRVQLRGCRVINSWAWHALVFDAFSHGAAAATIEDVLVQDFTAVNVGGFFQAWNAVAAPGGIQRVALRNCLGLGNGSTGRGNVLRLLSTIEDFAMVHCTILNLNGGMMKEGGGTLPRFTLRDNITPFSIAIEGATGGWKVPFTGDIGSSLPAWDACALDRDWAQNAFVDMIPEPVGKERNRRQYWSGAWLTADEYPIPGVDLQTGVLAATSPFRGLATDQTDLGVDHAALTAAQTAPVPGDPLPLPTPGGGTPVPDPIPPPTSSLMATFHGLSMENRVGPSSVPGAGGGPDLKIALAGLRAPLAGVMITAPGGNRWGWPSGGWAVVIDQTADDPLTAVLYYEQAAPSGLTGPFTVRVTYPDGTADEALAVPPPTPIPEPEPEPAPLPAPIDARLAALEAQYAALIEVDKDLTARIGQQERTTGGLAVKAAAMDADLATVARVGIEQGQLLADHLARLEALEAARAKVKEAL